MARYQEFNTQEVIGKAMNVFWDKGYKGASLSDLLIEMGIGKGSFYATFGSKHELFLDALKLYGKKKAMVREVNKMMAHLPAKIAIKELLDCVIDRALDDKRCCMFGKTALEFWQRDEKIAKEVEEGIKQVEEAFRQMVLRGQTNGEISVNKDPESIGQFLTGIFYGVQVLGSGKPERKALEGIVSNALKILD